MRASKPRFIQAGDQLIREDAVRRVDISEFDTALRVKLYYYNGFGNVWEAQVEGIYAIEALMLLKPSALEGRRLRWARRAWLTHNLVGHPLMQILSLLKLHRWALAVHDATVPRPLSHR